MTTAIIPARNARNVWAAFHGLPAAGYPVKAAAAVIEPVQFIGLPPEDTGHYRVTSGHALTIAG